MTSADFSIKQLNQEADSLWISGPLLLEGHVDSHNIDLFKQELKHVQLDPSYVKQSIAYIDLDHSKEEEKKAGLMIKVYWNSQEEEVWFEGIITSKKMIPILVERYNDSKPISASAEIRWNNLPNGMKTNLVVTGMAITDKPAIKKAGIYTVCDDKCCITLPRSPI
jgi:hypothetical protein